MDRSPIIMLHGWGGSFAGTFGDSRWGQALDALNRPVVGLDLPGHGPRIAPLVPEAYDDLAGQVLAQIAPHAEADIIGFSLGAKIAVEMASRHPRRFRRIVLGGVGDNIFAPEASGAAVAEALETADPQPAHPGVRALVDYARKGDGDPKALAAVLRRPANPVADLDRMAAIESDVLIVNGYRDGLARPESRLVDALRAQLLLVPEADHLGLLAARGFRDAATAFLVSGAAGTIPATDPAD